MQVLHDYTYYLNCVEHALTHLVPSVMQKNSAVSEAAQYSLMSGGKRVRGVLTLSVCDMLCGNVSAATYYAVGIEMLHAYSLIHDDLPCMDNDDFRRGKPSCHKAFDEATALLAGDALLTGAFAMLTQSSEHARQNAKAVSILSNHAGAKGMIYGQELDLANEQKNELNEEELRAVHHYKTGALINAAVQLGAVAANASSEQCKTLEEFAYTLGLVFQIIDDILDVTATQEDLGKPTGSDSQNGKLTFVGLKGISESHRIAESLTKQANLKLSQVFGDRAEFLISYSNSLLNRTH